MRPRRIASLLLAGIAALGLAACGAQNSANTAAQQAKTAGQQATGQLSPQAGQLLENAQSLTAHVVSVGRSYANAEITRQQALTQLDQAQKRAQELANKADQLPATSKARSGLKDLTGQAQSSASTLSDQIRSGKGHAKADITPQLDQLQASAGKAYRKLRDDLPQSTRQQVQKTLDKIQSLVG